MSDLDCAWGHACFVRDGLAGVPGCHGDGELGVNYCYKPPKAVLVLNGLAGNPSKNYPLKECQGDCSSDLDCYGDLQCMVRSDIEPVPGCTGSGLPGYSYCFDPVT